MVGRWRLRLRLDTGLSLVSDDDVGVLGGRLAERGLEEVPLVRTGWGGVV